MDTELRDRQLLDRFVGSGDEAAFAELVRRHGPAVWRVCRRFSEQDQDAEDAFQAAFFILARKASSIRTREAVGSWLYGVACRIAMKARRGIDRRKVREQHVATGTADGEPWSQAACRELQRALDEEVACLPEKLRGPFVLCCLEGMSRSEAARELSLPEGTLSGRLAQARKKLQTRLARRGITLSAALTATALALNVSSAAPPAALLHGTAETVLAAAMGTVAENALTPAAVSLAQALLGSTATATVKAATLLMLALVLTAGSAFAALLGMEQDQPDGAQRANRPELATVAIDEQVLTLAFSPDGKKLVTAGARHVQPGQLKVSDVATKENLVRVRGVNGIRSVAYAPGAGSIATGVFGGELILRDPVTGQAQATARGHTVGVNSVAFSADGKLLATAGLDSVVKLWDVSTLREKQAFLGHTDMVFSVAYFRHGRALVSGGQDKTARIWDSATGKEKFTLIGHRAPVEVIAISGDDRIVATGSWDRTIRFWDPDTGQLTAELAGHDGSVLAMAFSPDDKLLACATHSGKVRLWDVATRKVSAELGRHAEPVWAIAFSPDGSLLASGSSDRTAKLWDIAGRTEAASIQTGEGPPPVNQAVPVAPQVKPAAEREARPGEAQQPNTTVRRSGGRTWLFSAIGILVSVPLCALLLYTHRRAGMKQALVPASPGLFRFNCTHCHKPLKCKPDHAGKTLRCPHCREAIAVPAPETADGAPAPGASRFALSHKWRSLGGLGLLGLTLTGALLVVLHRPPRQPLLNVVVGREFVAEVEESGFHGQQYDKQARPFRWTDGAARLSIPIDPRQPPQALRLQLWPWRPPQLEPAQVRIVINQRELVNERLRDMWEASLDLSGIALGSAVELEIHSDTFIPKQFDAPADSRPHGVQVRAVELLGAAEVQELTQRFLGCKRVPGVVEAGFHGQQYAKDGEPSRWTDGNARLVIPLERGRRLQALQVHLFPWRPAQAPLASVRIVANARELFQGRLPRQGWQQSFDLSDLSAADQFVVELVSDTFAPADFDKGGDRRQLGVEVRGLKLVYRGDESAR